MMARAVPLLLLLAVAVLHVDSYYFKSQHHTRHYPQRFQYLDKLLNRLESAEPTTVAPAGPLDSYEYEDEDEEDEDAYDDDDDFDDDEESRPQSDDHSSSSDGSQFRNMSPASRSKWLLMGTRDAVAKARQSKILPPDDASKEKALENYVRVSEQGKCKVPKPKLVQVKNEYPHPSKIYLPRCTILHQCGDDTGCCMAETQSCVPRFTHRVDLYFFTSVLGSPQRVERLTFFNHTECMCEDKSVGLLPRDMESGHYFRKYATYGSGSLLRDTEAKRPVTKSCRCPGKYSVRLGRDGMCSCDCFDKQRDCLRLKKGKDYFTPHDRLCVQNEDCKMPSCEFGTYLRLAGRCPKKRERFEPWDQ